MELAQQCNKIISESIDTIVTSKNMQSYLDIIARFPYLTCENHALLWAQDKDAKIIHGAAAWKSMGRDIKLGEKAIALIVPQLFMSYPGDLMIDEDGNIHVDGNHPIVAMYDRQPNFEYSDKILGVFDISQTEGEKLPKIVDNFDFEKNIKKQGLLIKEVPKKDLDKNRNYEIDEDGIVISSEIAVDKEIKRALILGYAEYVIKQKIKPRAHVKELLFCIRYVLQMHFLGDAKDKLFGIFDTVQFSNSREKQSFLGEITKYCTRFMSELSDVRYLDFASTSVLNCVLDCDTLEGFNPTMIRAGAFLEKQREKMINQTWTTLFRESTDEEKKELFNKKMNKQLYFEPPFRLTVPEKKKPEG